MFSDLANSGAMPILEQVVRFAGQRQRLIAHNIANASTPDFQPMDVSITDFQRNLADAVEERRQRTGGESGELRWEETGELRKGPNGELVLVPGKPSGGVLFHDHNNRDMERLMQALAENQATYRIAIDLLKSRGDMLRAAIAQRVA